MSAYDKLAEEFKSLGLSVFINKTPSNRYLIWVTIQGVKIKLSGFAKAKIFLQGYRYGRAAR